MRDQRPNDEAQKKDGGRRHSLRHNRRKRTTPAKRHASLQSKQRYADSRHAGNLGSLGRVWGLSAIGSRPLTRTVSKPPRASRFRLGFLPLAIRAWPAGRASAHQSIVALCAMFHVSTPLWRQRRLPDMSKWGKERREEGLAPGGSGQGQPWKGFFLPLLRCPLADAATVGALALQK